MLHLPATTRATTLHGEALAAADAPMDVEPSWHRIAATPEQRAKPCALRLPALQARQQVVEPPRDIELRGICVELMASDLRAQAPSHVPGHILRHRRNDSPQPSLRLP